MQVIRKLKYEEEFIIHDPQTGIIQNQTFEFNR